METIWENDKELKKLKNSDQKKEAKNESACKISKDLMSPFRSFNIPSNHKRISQERFNFPFPSSLILQTDVVMAPLTLQLELFTPFKSKIWPQSLMQAVPSWLVRLQVIWVQLQCDYSGGELVMVRKSSVEGCTFVTLK